MHWILLLSGCWQSTQHHLHQGSKIPCLKAGIKKVFKAGASTLLLTLGVQHRPDCLAGLLNIILSQLPWVQPSLQSLKCALVPEEFFHILPRTGNRYPQITAQVASRANTQLSAISLGWSQTGGNTIKQFSQPIFFFLRDCLQKWTLMWLHFFTMTRS